MTRGRVLAVTAAVAVISIGVWRAVSVQDPASGSPEPVASTVTEPSTPTTDPPPVVIDPDLVVVATAATAGTVLEVLEHEPDGFVPDPHATDARAQVDAAHPPPTSPAAAAALPAIPREGYGTVAAGRTGAGWAFASPTPFGGPLTFVVTEDHGEWLRVLVPVRPNGSEGWVRADQVTLSTHRFRVEVSLSERRLRAFDGATALVDTPVVIGDPDRSPTPVGRSYLWDKVPKPPEGDFGPWVLALSSFSERLDLFDGAAPVIAIHGTNRPDLLGQAISNGCIRVTNDVITALALLLPPGTPVDVLP